MPVHPVVKAVLVDVTEAVTEDVMEVVRNNGEFVALMIFAVYEKYN